MLERYSHRILATTFQPKNIRHLHAEPFASQAFSTCLASLLYADAHAFSSFSKPTLLFLFYYYSNQQNGLTSASRSLSRFFKQQIIKSILQSESGMLENQKTPSLDKKKQIEWQHYNYPPVLNIMHFVPSQVPQDRRFLVLSLFALHLASVGACLLNFIDNCIEGGIGILYSLLFMFVFVPVLLYLFHRGLTGICKKQASLKIYLILQPIAIVLEIVAAIGNFLGFNGFVRVSEMFGTGQGAAAVFGLIVSLVFLGMAVFSGFIYFRIVKERAALKENLI